MTVEAFLAAYPAIAERIEPRAFLDPVFVYETPQQVDGDLVIDRLNQPGEAGSYVFLSDLEIAGSLLNWNGDFGIALVVEGETRAQNVVAGGSFIYLQRAVVPGVILGHYNHGMIQVRDHVGDLTINQDHHTDVFPYKKGVLIADFPHAGLSIYVDDLKLAFDTQYETANEVLVQWFGDSQWVNREDYSAEDWEYALLEGEFVIDWLGWAEAAISAGAPAQDDEFDRFTSHVRAAFVEAAKAGTDD